MKLRLELFVRNIERSIEFYRNVLDFSVPEGKQEDYVPISKGDVVIGLGEMEKLPCHHPIKAVGDTRVGLGVEIVVEVEDIHVFYNNVVSKGYPIQSNLTERPWGLVDFRIMDPDGYYVRITSSN